MKGDIRWSKQQLVLMESNTYLGQWQAIELPQAARGDQTMPLVAPYELGDYEMWMRGSGGWGWGGRLGGGLNFKSFYL